MPVQNGQWSDLHSLWMQFTEGSASPLQYREWSGIAMIAGALERRVWCQISADRLTYPNLYTMLVGQPGIGKQIIDQVAALWEATLEAGTKQRAFKVAPDSLSKAALMDELSDSKATRLTPDGARTFSSLLVAAEEFEVLLPNYDKEFIGVFNKLFNCVDLPYRERRRTSVVKKLAIEAPCLNLLAGATPAYFTATFPEEAWETGLARRIIMIYAGESPFVDLFAPALAPISDLRAMMLQRLGQLSRLWGQFSWTPAAAQTLIEWHRAGDEPKPQHTKLKLYVRSRPMFAAKLAMISAVSRTGQLVIEESDTDRALEWLFSAERLMPDIFREMRGKSDLQVIEELHLWATSVYMRAGAKRPLTTGQLTNFLAARVPSERVRHVLEVADKAQYVSRVAGTDDCWIPRAKPFRQAELE